MAGEVDRRRRVHLKSRAGCVNCKARRIKCQETRPSCENCNQKNLACVYRRPEKDGPLLLVKQPSSRPHWPSAQFSMPDFQLYHHFIFNASTILASDRLDIWTVELPRIANQNEFLMHALLSFAGTHLSALGCSTDSAATIGHRLIALQGVSEALQSFDKSGGPDQSTYDALLATFLLFQIQSTFMSDGLLDYLIMGRGSGLLMQHVRGNKSIDDWQLRNLRDYSDRKFHRLSTDTTGFRKSQAAALVSSLASLELSCITPEDQQFCAGMQVVSKWVVEPQQQHNFRVGSIWMHFANMSAEDWKDFIDPENLGAQKIQAHYCAVLLFLRAVYPTVQFGNITLEPLPALTTWIRQLSDNIARLSGAQTPALSQSSSTELCISDSGDSNLVSPSSTCCSGIADSYVPLQIANEFDMLEEQPQRVLFGDVK